MSVNEAEPGDIYADKSGKLWRVVGICGEPTVLVQEIETLCPDSPVRMNGGVSGMMWDGFKKFFDAPIINQTEIAMSADITVQLVRDYRDLHECSLFDAVAAIKKQKRIERLKKILLGAKSPWESGRAQAVVDLVDYLIEQEQEQK